LSSPMKQSQEDHRVWLTSLIPTASTPSADSTVAIGDLGPSRAAWRVRSRPAGTNQHIDDIVSAARAGRASAVLWSWSSKVRWRADSVRLKCNDLRRGGQCAGETDHDWDSERSSPFFLPDRVLDWNRNRDSQSAKLN
jgi:hypothetical protein